MDFWNGEEKVSGEVARICQHSLNWFAELTTASDETGCLKLRQIWSKHANKAATAGETFVGALQRGSEIAAHLEEDVWQMVLLKAWEQFLAKIVVILFNSQLNLV